MLERLLALCGGLSLLDVAPRGCALLLAGHRYAEIVSTSSPTCSRPSALAKSPWLTRPIRSWPSITGSRLTLCSLITFNASSAESSAPMVTGLPCASSEAVVCAGSLPSARTLITMSRSVSIPFKRLSSPQIGSEPTSSLAIFSAAAMTDSFSPTHSAPPVMISRAVFPITDAPLDAFFRFLRPTHSYETEAPRLDVSLKGRAPTPRNKDDDARSCLSWFPLADLFGQGDDDARGAAEVAEPVAVLVLRHPAEEFGAVGAQAGDGVVDVVDSEHDTMQAQRVGRRVLRLGADRRGGVVLRQLQLAVTVRGPHHRDIAADTVESDGAVRPEALDLRFAFQLHAELGEERDGGIQVFHDNADVVHPLNRHGGGSPSSSRSP